MDPTACLKRVRELADSVLRTGDPEAGCELAHTVMDLDLWLRRGGFLPTQWRKTEVSRELLK